MTREELREELVQLLADMADSELRYVFNNYCEKSGYDDDFIEDMDNFDEIFQGSAWDAVRAAYYGDFRPTDNYFKFNGYGNLVSFDYIDSPESPFDAEQVADYIIENDDDLDNSDIRELLDSADEFEESVRRNRRSNRISESSRRRRNRRMTENTDERYTEIDRLIDYVEYVCNKFGISVQNKIYDANTTYGEVSFNFYYGDRYDKSKFITHVTLTWDFEDGDKPFFLSWDGGGFTRKFDNMDGVKKYMEFIIKGF